MLPNGCNIALLRITTREQQQLSFKVPNQAERVIVLDCDGRLILVIELHSPRGAQAFESTSPVQDGNFFWRRLSGSTGRRGVQLSAAVLPASARCAGDPMLQSC